MPFSLAGAWAFGSDDGGGCDHSPDYQPNRASGGACEECGRPVGAQSPPFGTSLPLAFDVAPPPPPLALTPPLTPAAPAGAAVTAATSSANANWLLSTDEHSNRERHFGKGGEGRYRRFASS